MKNKILRIVIMLLVVTMVGATFAPIASYATSKAVSKSAELKTTNKTTTTTSANTTAANKTTESNTSVVNKIIKSLPTVQSKSLNKTYETIIENVSKESRDDTKKVENLDGIEANLETKIYKAFSEIEKAEVGSTLVYTIYLKNSSNISKDLIIKSNTKISTIGINAIALICNIERNIEDSEAEEGLVEEKRLNYNGSLDITLAAGEEKAVRIEQDITKYNGNTLANTFTITCGDSTMELNDEKQATTPAKINAAIKLFVNNEEISSGGEIELKESDDIKYVIDIENTGETAEKIAISENLPREIQITKVEYLDKANKVLASEEYESNSLVLENIELVADGYYRIVLTVKPLVNGEITVDNFATINGNNIKELSTNTLTNTYVVSYVVDPIQAKETFETELPTRGTSEDILAHFGDVSFLGYGLNNLGKKITIGFKNQFTPSKIMYCVSEGKSYYKNLKIENFFVSYNSKIYKYNKSTQKLEEYSGTIGIGNDQNFIDAHYNELAYILSVIDDYNTQAFYESLGIGFAYNGERPDHRLSPVQIAIWRLQGVSESKMVQKMNNRLKELGVSSSSTRNKIINNILSYATTIYANAAAYNKYVNHGYIGTQPNVSFSNYDPIQVNGKTLVGPFKISYNLDTATASYTDVITGNTKTKTGRYGNIKEVKLTNNGNTYTTIYDSDGNPITLSTVKSNQLDCYFDITGKDFDLSKETKITTKMNNQYRHAYFYTIASQYSNGQNIIVGRGTRSFKSYSRTFTIEKMSLSGIVWLDIQQGIKGQTKAITPPNGIIDENEEGIEGIDVYLLDNAKNQIVRTTKTNNEGRYAFNNIIKSNYSVLFGYEGMNYIVSEASLEEQNSTKTKVKEIVDGANLRQKFNNRFSVIIRDKKISKYFNLAENGVITEKNNDDYIMQYNQEQSANGNNVSTLITTNNNDVIPAYKMFAKTTEIYNTTTNNINMGLKTRTGDISLDAYITNVDTSKTGTTAKDSYITYAVELNNQDTKLSVVNAISYYYNRNLELVDAECRYKRNNVEVIEHDNIQISQDSNTTIDGIVYSKINVNMPISAFMTEGARTTLYLKFKIKDGALLTDDFKAYGEITSYSIDGGIVDIDSEPNNGIKQDGTTLPEDDFGVVEESKIRTYLILSALHGITVKP